MFQLKTSDLKVGDIVNCGFDDAFSTGIVERIEEVGKGVDMMILVTIFRPYVRLNPEDIRTLPKYTYGIPLIAVEHYSLYAGDRLIEVYRRGE